MPAKPQSEPTERHTCSRLVADSPNDVSSRQHRVLTFGTFAITFGSLIGVEL